LPLRGTTLVHNQEVEKPHRSCRIRGALEGAGS